MFTGPRLYYEALRELEKEFGDPARVIQATMKRVLTARPVRDGELSALTDVSRDLHTAVSVLQGFRYDAELAAATTVTAVTGKLPSGLAWKWGDHVTERDIKRPTLVDLDKWLRHYVAAGRVAVNQTGHKPPPKVEVSASDAKPRRVFTTTSAASPREQAINSERRWP